MAPALALALAAGTHSAVRLPVALGRPLSRTSLGT